MTSQTLLYGVGATKAGTSWLYRMLADHPECKLRAVKEAHYWDTFDARQQAWQAKAFDRKIAELTARKADFAGKPARIANLQRQIDEIAALQAVIAGDRDGDRAYADWLGQGAEGAKLIGDLTPAYGLADATTLKRMVALSPLAKVVYLVRDPLARLWSHLRMVVTRKGQPAEAAEAALAQLIDGQGDADIVTRGDYAATITTLRSAVPADRLRIAFTEPMFAAPGWAALCEFLGIRATGLDAARRVHEGAKAPLNDALAARAVRFLKDQYDWVAANVGPLPREWQDNLARVHA